MEAALERVAAPAWSPRACSRAARSRQVRARRGPPAGRRRAVARSRARPRPLAGERLRALAARLDTTPAALAIAFTLEHPRVASTLFGATSPSSWTPTCRPWTCWAASAPRTARSCTRSGARRRRRHDRSLRALAARAAGSRRLHRARAHGGRVAALPVVARGPLDREGDVRRDEVERGSPDRARRGRRSSARRRSCGGLCRARGPPAARPSERERPLGEEAGHPVERDDPVRAVPVPDAVVEAEYRAGQQARVVLRDRALAACARRGSSPRRTRVAVRARAAWRASSSRGERAAARRGGPARRRAAGCAGRRARRARSSRRAPPTSAPAASRVVAGDAPRSARGSPRAPRP